ncbi:MAG: hypothetical protein ACRDNK_23070 [Solirubrobacteraceae bacterium]
MIYNGEPMEQSEANHLEFEAFYKLHDAANAKVLAELEAAADAAVSPPDPVVAEPQREND